MEDAEHPCCEHTDTYVGDTDQVRLLKKRMGVLEDKERLHEELVYLYQERISLVESLSVMREDLSHLDRKIIDLIEEIQNLA